MAFLDEVIRYMVEKKGTAFHIPAGKNMVMQVGEQAFPQKQILPPDQVLTLIRQLTPPAMQAHVGAGDNYEFPYTNDRGTFTLAVRQTNGVPELIIMPPATPGQVGSGGQAQTVQPARPAAGGDMVDRLLNVSPDRIGTRPVEHLDELFHILMEVNGSDLHVSSTVHPVMRIHGTLHKLQEFEILTSEHLHDLLWAIAPQRNQDEWDETHDTDFAYEIPGMARFRCNFSADRHGIVGVFRLIPTQIASVEDLNLPKAMVDLCYLSKGLVVVTGPTGSGKSTTLAALVDYVNRVRTDHIITIEDPIEFVHENNQCLVNQREVHVHTDSFKKALRAALREDPDIVLVGEMRDLETVAIAIETAETGHLVFATLHTSSAASTVDRIIDQFPSSQQEQIRVMLSESLVGVIAQTLLRKKGGGRIAAWEILLCPPAIANLIREKKTYQLSSMIQVNKAMGMITMNDAVCQLVKDGTVEAMDAYMKVIDKVGLVTMFEKEHIDFKVPSQQDMLGH